MDMFSMFLIVSGMILLVSAILTYVIGIPSLVYKYTDNALLSTVALFFSLSSGLTIFISIMHWIKTS